VTEETYYAPARLQQMSLLVQIPSCLRRFFTVFLCFSLYSFQRVYVRISKLSLVTGGT
jgi:hypothetical protein